MREVPVSRGEAGRRLDKYLMKYLNAAPPGFIYKMLRKKRVKLNHARAEGSEILQGGDVVTFYLSDETIAGFTAEKTAPWAPGDLDVVFEDSDILIVNKPAGMLVHSDKPGGVGDLAGRLAHYLSQRGPLPRTFDPAPSNRLDRNTSGVVACGKNPAAVRAINDALAAGLAEKFYLAAVSGLAEKPGRFSAYISKDRQSNESVVSGGPLPNAKRIATEYEPVGWGNGCTLLRVKLITGKAHQIRAHLKFLGLPVLGDPKYGNPQANESMRKKHNIRCQLLHAESLAFLAKAGLLEKYCNTAFHAPAPDYFVNVLEKEITKKGVLYESYNFGGRLCDKALPLNAHHA